MANQTLSFSQTRTGGEHWNDTTTLDLEVWPDGDVTVELSSTQLQNSIVIDLQPEDVVKLASFLRRVSAGYVGTQGGF